MPRSVSATTAAKSFGALASRVREEQATYVVERSGVPVVEIRPATTRRCTLSDLARLLATCPPPDEAYLATVEEGIARLNRPTRIEDSWAR